MTTEAEIGVLRPQTKEHLEAPEAGADKEGSFPRASRGSVALLTPVLQSCEKVHWSSESMGVAAGIQPNEDEKYQGKKKSQKVPKSKT